MGKPLFDVGIVIPLNEELKYVKDVAPIIESFQHDGAFFHRLNFGTTKTVCCLVGAMGNLPALQSAIQLLRFADIKLLVVLGLAGALDDIVSIGDVVVATEVTEYQANSKAVASEGGYAFNYSGHRWTLDYRLSEAIRNFEFANKDVFEQWQSAASSEFSSLSIPDKSTFCPPMPSLLLGSLASGDVVAATRAYVKELKRIDRKFIAIDMEAAGVTRAASNRPHPIPCLVIRGVSDHADEGKEALDSQFKGAWRRYCVRNAATFLRSLLSWRDFLHAAGIGTEVAKNADDALKNLLSLLREHTGGPWIVGVALGVYSHGPRIIDDEQVIPVDIGHLRLADPRVEKLITAADRLIEDFKLSDDISTIADSFIMIVNEYRGEMNASKEGVDTMLKEFDNVVTTILLPDDTDAEIEAVILESQRIAEDIGLDAAGQFLKPLVNIGPIVREKYVETLSLLERWSDIIATLHPQSGEELSRFEIEQLIISCTKEDRLPLAREMFARHDNNYNDNGAKIFRVGLIGKIQ